MTRLLLPKDAKVFGAVVLGHGVYGNKPLLPILWSMSGLDSLAGPSIANTPHTEKYTPMVPCSICYHFRDISTSYSNLMVVASVE